MCVICLCLDVIRSAPEMVLEKEQFAASKILISFLASSASGKSLYFTTQANTWGPLLSLWTQ